MKKTGGVIAVSVLVLCLLSSCSFLEKLLGLDDSSSAKAITAFSLPKATNPALAADVAGVINEEGKSISLSLPAGTAVTALRPEVAVSADASVSPSSGAPKDFSSPVVYTVTAADSSTQAYVVTVTVDAPAIAFSLTSPTARVYTQLAPPSLTYTSDSSRTITLSLNGAAVSVANNGLLAQSVTGLNHLVVTESDGTDTTATATVDYFLNNLSAVDSDAFTGTDASIPDGAWGLWSALNNGASLERKANAIAVRGALTNTAWGVLTKAYAPTTETKCIQACDVTGIVNQTGYVVVGYLGNPGEMFGAQLVKTNAGYDLFVTEASYSLIPSPYYTVAGNTTLTGVTAGQAIRVYFYRNGSAYQAVAADASGGILARVGVSSYSSLIAGAGRLTQRGIILAPFDTSSSTSVMVTADNYAYYQ